MTTKMFAFPKENQQNTRFGRSDQMIRTTAFRPVFRARNSGQRGFTLVEILVVAIVISLLSAIAVINIQQFVDNNKRKSVIADARSLATALGFSHDDIGFYPKLCFLDSSKTDPGLSIANAAIDPAVQAQQIDRFHNFFQLYGLNYQSSAGFGAVNNWRGPYISISSTRSGASQGQGGSVFVEIPADNGFSPTDPNNGAIQEWPADVWGQPYVVYAMKWELNSSGVYERRFIGVDLDGNPRINEFRESPDAFLAIVSYGKNAVPGLDEFSDQDIARRASRMFTESTSTVNNPRPVYRMFDFLEIGNNQRAVLSNTPDVIPTALGTGPGILDRGSDDVVIEF
jgi:prepilin-type N-terminal cleavage/methylation domain-containing protein